MLYPIGIPQIVVTDDSVPFYTGTNPDPVFMRAAPDAGIWPSLLEKLYAKAQGNYENIVGGNQAEGVRLLTGAPGKFYNHTDYTASQLFD